MVSCIEVFMSLIIGIVVVWLLLPVIPAFFVLALSALTLPFRFAVWLPLKLIDVFFGGKV